MAHRQSSDAFDLRASVEATLDARAKGAPGEAAMVGSVDALLHELQVHQIELEMSNEALIESQTALEASRDEYVALYEFAPVAYLSLDADGKIVRINHTGASLLRLTGEALLQKRFIAFVAAGDQSVWSACFLRARAQAEPACAELALVRADGTHDPCASGDPGALSHCRVVGRQGRGRSGQSSQE
jgi:PAS domain S-box-containing protein